jgi:sulfur relay (sulfurtransferase) complex TusBCD TusD component (DsrE family)
MRQAAAATGKENREWNIFLYQGQVLKVNAEGASDTGFCDNCHETRNSYKKTA